MAAQKRVYLLAGVPGTSLRQCAENLRLHGKAQGTAVNDSICVESVMAKLEKVNESDVGTLRGLVRVLELPFSQLLNVCRSALLSVAGEIAQKADGITFVTFHPVLFHQLTSEFLCPYSGALVKDTFEEKGLVLEGIVSIHDDIYDVYANLLQKNQVFDPKITREPVLLAEKSEPVRLRDPIFDLKELRLILDWRDRELTESRSIAAESGCSHLLFHKKGKRQALWQIVADGYPCVYFSHPISQPRRDLLGKADREKCLTPDRERGAKLQSECNDAARLLSTFVPTIEPTWIDELRIDLKRIETIEEGQLRESILPTLTERWPLNEGVSLGGKPPAEQHNGVTYVGKDVFEGLSFQERSVGELRGAQSLLASEIGRQINVRDHVLAEQAGVTVAYRPFSLPDSPRPTGGVEEEINVMQRKLKASVDVLKPSIYIVHPREDEVRRRENEFKKIWPIVKSRLEGDERRANELEKLWREIIVKIEEGKSLDDLRVELQASLEKAGVQVKAKSDSSSMPSGSLARMVESSDELVETVVSNTELFRSKLHEVAEKYPEHVKILNGMNELEKCAGEIQATFTERSKKSDGKTEASKVKAGK